MEGSAPSEPAPPPPPLLFSPPASFSLALPPPRTLRRREGELPGVLRGELLAVLPLDEFPPFLLSCSASKTSRATVRDVMLKSTFSQEHINMLRMHQPAGSS